MAKRYELSDAPWELIKDLVHPGRKWVVHVVMIVWYSTKSFGFCAQVLLGVICRSALGRGRRCISVFVTGAMTVRATGYWSACTFDSTRERLIDLDTWMIDSTAVRATRASSGAGKKGGLKNR
jgi:hypothetical protein